MRKQNGDSIKTRVSIILPEESDFECDFENNVVSFNVTVPSAPGAVIEALESIGEHYGAAVNAEVAQLLACVAVAEHLRPMLMVRTV